MKLYFKLFITFLKIGAFTFGGGYAMIPLITRETVLHHRWIDDSDILDIIAIAESTPGPIAVNAATFVGYKIAGFGGAFFSTLGVILPSFVIIYIISFILNLFQSMKPVQYAFCGIRAGVLALLIKALVSMYRQCPKSLMSYILMGLAFAASALLGVNVLLIILACALIGIISAFFAKNKEDKKS
ncbi:MAG: chromate transporter [bacterium]|nr:chromate transporter [bacterium]